MSRIHGHLSYGHSRGDDLSANYRDLGSAWTAMVYSGLAGHRVSEGELGTIRLVLRNWRKHITRASPKAHACGCLAPRCTSRRSMNTTMASTSSPLVARALVAGGGR